VRLSLQALAQSWISKHREGFAFGIYSLRLRAFQRTMANLYTHFVKLITSRNVCIAIEVPPPRAFGHSSRNRTRYEYRTHQDSPIDDLVYPECFLDRIRSLAKPTWRRNGSWSPNPFPREHSITSISVIRSRHFDIDSIDASQYSLHYAGPSVHQNQEEGSIFDRGSAHSSHRLAAFQSIMFGSQAARTLDQSRRNRKSAGQGSGERSGAAMLNAASDLLGDRLA